jgi:hypothetical protein
MSKPPRKPRSTSPTNSNPAVSSSKRRPKHDVSTWIVTDDWPDEVPITEAEIEVFERYFGDVFDEMFGPIDPIARSKP